MTDRELLQRFVNQCDDTAFTELVRRHGGMVRAAAGRMAGQDADDVAQAVFLLLAQRAPKLLRYSDLAGWLYLTTRHTALNARRRAARRAKHLQNLSQAAMNQQTPSNAAETRELIDAALARLNDAHRQVVILRYLESASLEETATRIGISAQAVAKRAQHGLEKLKSFLAGRGIDSSVGAVAVLLQSQAASLSEPEVAALVSAAKGAATKAATGLASMTSATMTLATVKLAAAVIAVIGAIGIGGAVVTHHMAPRTIALANAPTAPAGPATPTPSAIAAVGNVKATDFAQQFLNALRDRDEAKLATMIDAPSPAAQRVQAAAIVKQFRDGPYAISPQQLTQIGGTIEQVGPDKKPFAAAIDAQPPTMANLQHLSLALQAVNGQWRVNTVVYTMGNAMETSATKLALPTSAPADPNVPPGTYTNALRAWRKFADGLDKVDPETLKEADKPAAIAALRAAPAQLHEIGQMLKGANLGFSQARIDAAAAMFSQWADVFEKQGIEALRAKGKEFEHSPAAADLNILWELPERLVDRVDVERDAQHPAPRPPSFAPTITVTRAWDGGVATLLGPLVVPAWLRESETFKLWQQRHNIQTFRTRDDAGNLYEVFCMGAGQDAQGVHELINAIRQYRPDGTLAATLSFDGDGKPSEWGMIDATGTKYVTRVRKNGQNGYEAKFFNADGSYRLWRPKDGVAIQEQLYDPAGNYVKTLNEPRSPATRSIAKKR